MKNAIIFAIVAVALAVVYGIPRWKQAQRAKKFDDYFEKQYGALGKTTDEILSHENPTNAFAVLGASNPPSRCGCNPRVPRAGVDNLERSGGLFAFPG